MKRVLWISRHEMTGEQMADLECILNEPISLVQWKDTVRDVSVLIPQIAEADIVAAVLPMDLLSQLMTLVGTRPVIQAVSGRLPTGRMLTLSDGRQEPEFAFSHLYWQQVLRLEVVSRRLQPQDLEEKEG